MVSKQFTPALKEQETARTEDETASDPQHTEVENEHIPEPVDLTADICRIDQHPIAHGGFADIWRATWNTQSGTCLVRSFPSTITTLSDSNFLIGRCQSSSVQHEQQ